MTDFLSRLVEQGSGRSKLIENENGVRPLIPPFFAPATSLPEQTSLWSYLATLPITIAPALASNEAAFPPEQPENFAMPADLVPEHLRRVPLPSPLMRNLLSIQDIVRPDNDEIAQDVVSDYEEINDFGGGDLNTIERENVNPGWDNVSGVYGPQGGTTHQQTPRYSADLAPASERHPSAPATNDQHSRHPTNDGRHAQSSSDHGSHPHPIEKLDVDRREDQFAPIVPTILHVETSISELPENEYSLEDKRKIEHMQHQSVHHAQSGPSAGALHLDTPIQDSGHAQAGASTGSHSSAIEQFIQRRAPIDSSYKDLAPNPHHQLLSPSGGLTHDNLPIQKREHIDGISASRTTIISPQQPPHSDDPIPEGQRAQSSSSTNTQHPGDLASNDNTTRRRLHIEGARRFRETPGPVNGHDGEITPVLPDVQSHTIVPLIEDAVKQEPAAQQAAEGGSPPVIHVRIGRVEVRATIPEPAPTSKPARASRPGLTLSEYMQQRKEVWQ
jgi:hypothetical protein